MTIAVIGGVGAGKSTVLEVLEQDYGFRIYRTDDLAKTMYHKGSPVFAALAELLGPEVLTEDGEGFQLPRFAEKLYADAALRKKVDGIVHPAVWREAGRLARRCEKEGGRAVVETALPNADFLRTCDEVWFVYTEAEERIRRLQESRGYSREKAESILRAQPADEEYAALSDFMINNSYTKEETLHEIYQHCKRFER